MQPSITCEAGHVLNESDIYCESPPPQGWAHAVTCCWEQSVSADRTQRVLPDGCADLIIYDSGRTEVVGLHDRATLPLLLAGEHLRGIRFRPEAVAAAFHTPGWLLRNETLPADSVLGSKMARQLAEAPAVDTWIRSIRPDPRMAFALDWLSNRSVDETADALGISGRQLRRLSEAQAGLPPKVFQQVVRLRRFVHAIDAGVALAAASAFAGYADQSHMTRAVHRFCAMTPARLAHERRSASRH